MQVGIIGDASRSAAWEKHLRPLNIVREVILAPTLTDVGNVDACIILDESDDNLDILNETIRLGIHAYIVARLPTDRVRLEKIYHSSQEADVRVQFSHWPTLAPSTQWMRQQLPKPRFMQINRENSYLQFTENAEQFHHQWIDEFAFVTKWMDSNIHRLDVNEMNIQGIPTGIRIHLNFENGSSASIVCLTAGHSIEHRRVISDGSIMIDLKVPTQHTRLIKPGKQDNITVEKKSFDATLAVELSLLLFLKAIQMKTETAFTPYDALKTATGVEKIHRALNRD